MALSLLVAGIQIINLRTTLDGEHLRTVHRGIEAARLMKGNDAGKELLFLIRDFAQPEMSPSDFLKRIWTNGQRSEELAVAHKSLRKHYAIGCILLPAPSEYIRNCSNTAALLREIEDAPFADGLAAVKKYLLKNGLRAASRRRKELEYWEEIVAFLNNNLPGYSTQSDAIRKMQLANVIDKAFEGIDLNFPGLLPEHFDYRVSHYRTMVENRIRLEALDACAKEEAVKEGLAKLEEACKQKSHALQEEKITAEKEAKRRARLEKVHADIARLSVFADAVQFLTVLPNYAGGDDVLEGQIKPILKDKLILLRNRCLDEALVRQCAICRNTIAAAWDDEAFGSYATNFRPLLEKALVSYQEDLEETKKRDIEQAIKMRHDAQAKVAAEIVAKRSFLSGNHAIRAGFGSSPVSPNLASSNCASMNMVPSEAMATARRNFEGSTAKPVPTGALDSAGTRTALQRFPPISANYVGGQTALNSEANYIANTHSPASRSIGSVRGVIKEQPLDDGPLNSGDGANKPQGLPKFVETISTDRCGPTCEPVRPAPRNLGSCITRQPTGGFQVPSRYDSSNKEEIITISEVNPRQSLIPQGFKAATPIEFKKNLQSTQDMIGGQSPPTGNSVGPHEPERMLDELESASINAYKVQAQIAEGNLRVLERKIADQQRREAEIDLAMQEFWAERKRCLERFHNDSKLLLPTRYEQLRQDLRKVLRSSIPCPIQEEVDRLRRQHLVEAYSIATGSGNLNQHVPIDLVAEITPGRFATILGIYHNYGNGVEKIVYAPKHVGDRRKLVTYEIQYFMAACRQRTFPFYIEQSFFRHFELYCRDLLARVRNEELYLPLTSTACSPENPGRPSHSANFFASLLSWCWREEIENTDDLVRCEISVPQVIESHSETRCRVDADETDIVEICVRHGELRTSDAVTTYRGKIEYAFVSKYPERWTLDRTMEYNMKYMKHFYDTLVGYTSEPRKFWQDLQRATMEQWKLKAEAVRPYTDGVRAKEHTPYTTAMLDHLGRYFMRPRDEEEH